MWRVSPPPEGQAARRPLAPPSSRAGRSLLHAGLLYLRRARICNHTAASEVSKIGALLNHRRRPAAGGCMCSSPFKSIFSEPG
jgi:hypothetical protein